MLAAAQRRAEQAELQGKLHLQQLQHLEARLAAAQADSGKHATVGELYSLLGSLEAAVSSGGIASVHACPQQKSFLTLVCANV